MATLLIKPVTRETKLRSREGNALIVTLSTEGITFREKGNKKTISVSLDKIYKHAQYMSK